VGGNWLGITQKIGGDKVDPVILGGGLVGGGDTSKQKAPGGQETNTDLVKIQSIWALPSVVPHHFWEKKALG